MDYPWTFLYLLYYVYYLMDLIIIPSFNIIIVDASTNDEIPFSGLRPLNLIDGTVSEVISTLITTTSVVQCLRMFLLCSFLYI